MLFYDRLLLDNCRPWIHSRHAYQVDDICCASRCFNDKLVLHKIWFIKCIISWNGRVHWSKESLLSLLWCEDQTVNLLSRSRSHSKWQTHTHFIFFLVCLQILLPSSLDTSAFIKFPRHQVVVETKPNTSNTWREGWPKEVVTNIKRQFYAFTKWSTSRWWWKKTSLHDYSALILLCTSPDNKNVPLADMTLKSVWTIEGVK